MSDAVDVDARGLRCPWPALRLARAMREGGAKVIVADDPVAAREIEVLAGERGWRVARIETSIGQGWKISPG